MPMLAEIDEPPRSRVPGMLLGLVVAAPIVAVLLVWFLPSLVAAVLGGAEGIDKRLRLEDQYMTSVCTMAMDVDRDEGLCKCVLATEFPALDCQAPFLTWSVERQLEQCGPESEAIAFCACVDTVAEAMARASPQTRDTEAQAYRNCQELPDALYLPTIEQLAPPE